MAKTCTMFRAGGMQLAVHKSMVPKNLGELTRNVVQAFTSRSPRERNKKRRKGRLARLHTCTSLYSCYLVIFLEMSNVTCWNSQFQ